MEPSRPDELRAAYEGGPEPSPPYAPDDPFGHKARFEMESEGPVFDDEDEYQAALDQWLEEMPVKLGPLDGKGFFRVSPGERCPVCDCPAEEMPGCYAPYAGRRWDCFEMFGHLLTAEERRAYLEHERKAPRLRLELPDGSGSTTV